MVNAAPGSGKTTTLVECIRRSSGNVLALAFNKSIAEELTNRIDTRSVKISTINSIGNWLLSIKRPMSVLTVSKYKEAIGLAGEGATKKDKKRKEQLVGFCSLLRNHAVKPGSFELEVLIEKFIQGSGVEFDDEWKVESLFDDAFALVSKLSGDNFKHDFDDQVYLPVLYRWRPSRTFDWIYVDESQDLSPVQLELIKLLGGPRSRYVFVGDRMQSIYAFRGADPKSLEILEKDFKTTQLPLSISYRCPASVVTLLQQLHPNVYMRDDAPEGKVEILGHFTTAKWHGNGMVIARTNAALLAVALLLKKRGRRVRLELTMEQDSILNYFRKHKETLKELDSKFTKIYVAARAQAGHNKFLKWKVNEAKEKHLIARYLFENFQDFTSADHIIATMKREPAPEFTAMSIHRAKGLESENVYVVDLNRDSEDAATSSTDPDDIIEELTWQTPLEEPPNLDELHEKIRLDLQQEMNVQYVAVSRSKMNLFFVNTDEGTPVPEIFRKWKRKYFINPKELT